MVQQARASTSEVAPHRASGPDGGVRLVVVDDCEVSRIGLSVVLDEQPDLEVVGACSDCRTAHDLVGRHRPDVVVADLNLVGPDCDGLDLCRNISTGDGAIPFVFVTACADPLVAEWARAVGASAYVVKRATAAAIARTVRQVAAGHPPSSFVVDPDRAHDPDLRRLRDARLTSREAEVLLLLAEGRTNRELAEAVGVAEATVKNHLHSALSKLGFARRGQAVAFTARLRWRTGQDDGWT
jgi:two-component system, NarL family, response regulator DevR